MKKILLALILTLGLVGLINAQAVKLGVVDTDRVLAQSNEAAEISRLFNLDLQNWRSQLRTMDEEVKTMEREFEIESLTRNEAAKREAQARIDAKKAEVGRFIEEYFGEGGRQEQRYRELLEPLTLKVQNIVKNLPVRPVCASLFHHICHLTTHLHFPSMPDTANACAQILISGLQRIRFASLSTA